VSPEDDRGIFGKIPGDDIGALRENKDGGESAAFAERIGSDGIILSFCRCISANT
jgi:hypothetical protein